VQCTTIGASAAFSYTPSNFHTVIANVGDLQGKVLGQRALNARFQDSHTALENAYQPPCYDSPGRAQQVRRQHGDARAAGMPVAMLADHLAAQAKHYHWPGLSPDWSGVVIEWYWLFVKGA